jgi:hypothetical protein
MSWASGDGVSPSRVGLGRIGQVAAGLGKLWFGAARHGLRWQHGGLSGLPCRLHWWTRHGQARHGTARHDVAGSDWAGRGMGCRQQHWGLRLPLLLSSEGRRGLVRTGLAWHGEAGLRKARRGKGCDGSTEGFRAFPAAFIGGHGMARHGMARHGTTWLGRTGLGEAWAADSSTGGFGSHCCSHQRADGAWSGLDWHGTARRGCARQGAARAAESSTELLWKFPAALFRGQTWHPGARLGDARPGMVGSGLAGQGEGRQRRQGEAGQPAFSCSP